MATKAEFDAVIGEVNTSLAAIAARIAALEAQVNAGGMSADDEGAVLAELNSLKAAVAAMVPATP